MAIEIIPIPNDNHIYGNFSRIVTLEEEDDSTNEYIFKLSKGTEYILVFDYEKGGSDSDITIEFSSSFDKETWYEYGFYSRDPATGIDTYVKTQLILSDSLKSIYVVSLPALMDYIKVSIQGVNDGVFKFNIAPIK